MPCVHLMGPESSGIWKQWGSGLMASPGAWQVPNVLVTQKVVGGQKSSAPCSCPPPPMPTSVTHLFYFCKEAANRTSAATPKHPGSELSAKTHPGLRHIDSHSASSHASSFHNQSNHKLTTPGTTAICEVAWAQLLNC